jgi:hypothetical protein
MSRIYAHHDFGEPEARKWLAADRDTWQKVIRDKHINTE